MQNAECRTQNAEHGGARCPSALAVVAVKSQLSNQKSVIANRLSSRLCGNFSGLTAWLLSLPGLAGALVLSLALLGLFQQPPLRGLYDTPVPLAIGLTLLLLPFALILRRLFRAHSAGSGLFAAELLRGSVRASVRARGARLARFLRARGRFWALFLLFSLAYFDLTASSILAPVGTAPAFVRLYNLMHYGRSALLSAMVVVAFALPLLLLAVAGAGRALYLRMAGDA